MRPYTISSLQERIHATSQAKGFASPATLAEHELVCEKLLLINSEIIEAMNVARDPSGMYDDFAEELADAVIRTLDLAEGLGLDLGPVINNKMAKNETRPAKHGKVF